MNDVDQGFTYNTAAIQQLGDRFLKVLNEDTEAHLTFSEAFSALEAKVFTPEQQQKMFDMLASIQSEMADLKKKVEWHDQQLVISQDQRDQQLQLDALRRENAALKTANAALSQENSALRSSDEQSGLMWMELNKVKKEFTSAKTQFAQSVVAFNEFREANAKNNFFRDTKMARMEEMLKEVLSKFAEPLTSVHADAPSSSPDDDKKGEKDDVLGGYPAYSQSIEKELEKKKRKFDKKKKEKEAAFHAKLEEHKKRKYDERMERIQKKLAEEAEVVKISPTSTEGEQPGLTTADAFPVIPKRKRSGASSGPKKKKPRTVITSSSSDHSIGDDTPLSVLKKKPLIVDDDLSREDADEDKATSEGEQEVKPPSPVKEAGTSSSAPAPSVQLEEEPVDLNRNPGKLPAVETDDTPITEKSKSGELSEEDRSLLRDALKLNMSVRQFKEFKQFQLEEYTEFAHKNFKPEDVEDAISAWKVGISLEQFQEITLNSKKSDLKKEADEWGLSVEEYEAVLEREKAKAALIKEDEKIARKYARSDVLAEAKIKPAERIISSKKTTAVEAQVIALQLVKQAEEEKKAGKKPGSNITPEAAKRIEEIFLKREMEKFRGCASRRRHPTKIKSIQRCDDNVIRIEWEDGVFENVRIAHLHTLGHSEWIEVQEIYQHRKGIVRDAVMQKLQECFDKSSQFEDTPKRNVFKAGPKPKRKAKQQKTIQPASSRLQPKPTGQQSQQKINIDDLLSAPVSTPADLSVSLPPINYPLEGDTSLPLGLMGKHGMAIDYPVHGIYFEANGKLMFQRTSELHLADLKHLINLRGLALSVKAAKDYSTHIVDEITRRGLDPHQHGMVLPIKEEDVFE